MKGGPVMFLLLLCSLSGVYIIIQKFLILKYNEINHDELSIMIKNRLTSCGKENTSRHLKTLRKYPLTVLATTIQYVHLPQGELEEAIKSTSLSIIPRLERNMNFLSGIITIAPILGLLGTVLGLIDIFNVMSGGGIGDANALSGGIATALITTVSGLGISIPFILCFHYLSHKTDLFKLSIERLVADIVTFCKQNQIQP